MALMPRGTAGVPLAGLSGNPHAMIEVLRWVLPPLLGAAIGWATNWLAIRMLFRPRQRRWGMQGLLPRRQPDLARRLGEVVSQNLVTLDELFAPVRGADLRKHYEVLIDRVMEKRLADFRALPLVGALLKPENLIGFRDTAVDELVDRQPEMMGSLQELAEDHIDIASMVEDKVAAFDMAELEAIIHKVAATEFRAIEWWGALLGGLIGLLQALLFAVLG